MLNSVRGREMSTRWARYRHYSNYEDATISEPGMVSWGAVVEYDVEEISNEFGNWSINRYPGPPDAEDPSKMEYGFVKVKTVKNMFLDEEVHISAYTFMPDIKFGDLYYRIEDSDARA